jgi:hypothetical protein
MKYMIKVTVQDMQTNPGLVFIPWDGSKGVVIIETEKEKQDFILKHCK